MHLGTTRHWTCNHTSPVGNIQRSLCLCKHDIWNCNVVCVCPFEFYWFTFSQLKFSMLPKTTNTSHPWALNSASEDLHSALFICGTKSLYSFLFTKLLVKVSYVDPFYVVYIMIFRPIWRLFSIWAGKDIYLPKYVESYLASSFKIPEYKRDISMYWQVFL